MPINDLFALILAVLLQENRLKAKSCRLRAFSLEKEIVLNLFNIMKSCGLTRLLLFRRESKKSGLPNNRLNILVINWKTYLCRLKKTENQ